MIAGKIGSTASHLAITMREVAAAAELIQAWTHYYGPRKDHAAASELLRRRFAERYFSDSRRYRLMLAGRVEEARAVRRGE